MIYAIVTLGLICLLLIFMLRESMQSVQEQNELAREERRDLQNQILALKSPDALTHVMSSREETRGSVYFVDDERQIQLEGQ